MTVSLCQVLRKSDDTSAGFEWQGQENYDEVGAAAMQFMREQMTELCGLETVPLPPATAYATPGLKDHQGPVVLLVCGSAPGGDVGVWGRSLCINQSTHEGAMFDYIERSKVRLVSALMTLRYDTVTLSPPWDCVLVDVSLRFCCPTTHSELLFRDGHHVTCPHVGPHPRQLAGVWL